LHQPRQRVAIFDECFSEVRQTVRPLISAPETPTGDDVGVVGRKIAGHKERLVHIGLGYVRHDRGAQSVAHHLQIADIVFIELDFELLVERLRVETGDLPVNLVH
jgi:hypothetical protein